MLAVVAVVLVVAVRAALPHVVARVLEEQGTARLAGTLAVGNVDLSLLRGEVVVADVTLHADDAPPDALPLVAWDRFWVNVGWLGLARKTVRIQDVGLDGLGVHVDRLAGGALVLPGLRPADDAPVVEDPPAPDAVEAAAPWAVVVERLTFDDGVLRLDDYVSDPPETRNLALPSLRLADLRLQPAPDAGPGRARVRIGLEDGSIEIATRMRAVPDGFDVAARIAVQNLPIDRVHVHLPELGWTASTGRVSALLSATISPSAPLVVRGRVALDDLGIEVPGEDAPALAWRRLAIEDARVDLSDRAASVGRVTLDGGRVLVRPNAPAPLPVLPDGGTPAEEDADDEEQEAGEVVVPVADDTEDAPPWTWSVETLAVTDTEASVFLEPPPLAVGVTVLDVTGLASAPGSEATVHAELALAGGEIVIDGPVVLDPPGGTLAVRIAGLDVGRLVAATGAAPLPLAATLGGEIEVAAREDPLVVQGRLELADVEAKVADGEEFRVAWKRLGLVLRKVAVAGVLPFGGGGAVGAVDLDLERVELIEPRVVATLTADGIVLPPTGGGAAAASTDVPAGTDPEPAPTPTPNGPAFTLVAGEVAVANGDVRFTDTTVTPTYRGRLARLAVTARGVRIPENRVDQVRASARLADRAPIEVRSERRGDAVTVTATVRDVPLSSFNPYASPSGYRIARGTLGLDSETRWHGTGGYRSESRFTLDGLAVTGAEGDALFRQTFGVPLSVALALLRDLEGRISLGVPVEGDAAGGATVAIGPIVREALARAIVGALASPLKLLGAVRIGGNRIEAFEPAPVAFTAGTARIAPASTAQVRQLGRALGQLPSLQIQIAGRAGPTDVRALAEQAVLAELDERGGFAGGVRNLLSGGERSRIRSALRARADGAPGPLDDDDAATLDTWVAEHPIDDTRLAALAAERVAMLQTTLIEHGAKTEQVLAGEPRISRKRGRPEVDVDVATDPEPDDAPS
jgi:hypothetical protein